MQKTWWVLLWGGLVVGGILGIFLFFPAVAVLFFGGVIFAYLLFPIVIHFQKKSMPITAAILLTFLLVMTLLLFLSFVVFPVFYKECLGFFDNAHIYLGFIVKAWGWVESKLASIFSFGFFSAWETTVESFIEQKTALYANGFLESLTLLPTRLSSLLLSPVISYYLLRDYDRIGDGLLRLFPPKYRSDVLLLSEEVHGVLWGFIKGNLFVSLVVATLTGLGLWILGVDYPLVLGILAGLMDIIPYFGPILGGIPVILLAMLQPEVNLFLVFLLLVFVQQFENIVVSPRVIGDAVGLHPIWIILLVFIGGSIGGILGMVLIIPLAAVAKVLGGFLYRRYVAYHFGTKDNVP